VQSLDNELLRGNEKHARRDIHSNWDKGSLPDGDHSNQDNCKDLKSVHSHHLYLLPLILWLQHAMIMICREIDFQEFLWSWFIWWGLCFNRIFEWSQHALFDLFLKFRACCSHLTGIFLTRMQLLWFKWTIVYRLEVIVFVVIVTTVIESKIRVWASSSTTYSIFLKLRLPTRRLCFPNIGQLQERYLYLLTRWTRRFTFKILLRHTFKIWL